MKATDRIPGPGLVLTNLATGLDGDYECEYAFSTSFLYLSKIPLRLSF